MASASVSKQNEENCVSEEEELAAISKKVKDIEVKIQELKSRKEMLLKRQEKLKNDIMRKKSEKLARRNWAQTDFPWSHKINEALKSVFKIDKFRPYQLPCINATMSGEDAILIMPTGGGKSLCFQLPAVVSKGVTLVVSPLVALMEDQLMGLKALGVNAAMLCASTNSSKEAVNAVHQAMTDKNSQLKLLYVTPEKLAKSKRFMTKLQKMHQIGHFARLAIDEVHCCSQWGHDFRPDYKFLGIMKSMFPDVPILGLTATATSKITQDVQNILAIQGCLILKASFNRPNLYYEVRAKSSVQKECNDELEDLLKTRYRGQSGIIYTTSIKDSEELMQDMRKRGLRIGCYHANLESELRSKVHKKWMSGEYQAVVATIAFGLGIDKPDVRFVIHHSISKSMENFYQESGRAGRDDKPAECVVFYKFGDIFRLSTMVFTTQTGLENLYGMVAYCLDSSRCRRAVIAEHFDEQCSPKDCMQMCDHCREPRESKEVNITKHCQSIYEVLAHAEAQDLKVTGQKLVDAWLGKGQANLKVKGMALPGLSREMCEHIVAYLLIESYLREDFHFTPYNTISYIRKGPRAAVVSANKHEVTMTIRGRKLTPQEVKDAGYASASSKSDNNKKNNSCSEGDSDCRTESSKKSSGSSSAKRKNSEDVFGTKKRKMPVVIVSDSEDDEDIIEAKKRSLES